MTGGLVDPALADAPCLGAAGGPTEADWAAAVKVVRDLPPDGRVLLICHVNPDGDALGSMLGFGLGLSRLAVGNLQATFPGSAEVPEPFQGMPGLDLLVPEADAYPDPDVTICFDAASEARLGRLADRLRDSVSIVVDHHASNTRFGTIHLVDPQAAATSVVAEEWLTRLGVELDAEIAECLYIALATDTGSFRFDVTAAVHQLAARLLATGIRADEISRRIFDTRPFDSVRLYGEVLSRAEFDPAAAQGRGLVWTYATLEDLARYGQRPYVLEPLIDSIRCAMEADVSCLIKQVAPEEWAVSLRSKGEVDVSRVAVNLGGGGHQLAAGFTGHGSVFEIMDAIRAELEKSVITPDAAA